MSETPIASSGEEALGLAIAIERHNRQAFLDWAYRFRAYDPDVAEFLEGLVDEERDHEHELIALHQHQFAHEEISPALPTELGRYHRGLEAIRQHFLLVDAASAAVLLETALEIERFTRSFYTDLLRRTADPGQAAVYERLSAYEAEHERQFEERLERLKSRARHNK